jgi:hypothetical protein
VLLGISLFYVAQIASIEPQIVAWYGMPYLLMFFLPKILPITVMGLYYLAEFKIQFLNRTLKRISYLSVIIGLAAFLMLLFGLILNLPSDIFFSSFYAWGYEAPLEWSFCFVVAWILTEIKTRDSLLSLTYSAQAICLGGMIHEVFFLLARYDLYYHLSYPLIIATSWLSLFFILLLMIDNKWHNHFLFSTSLFIYVIFSIFYVTVFNPDITSTIHFQTMWIQRLPTILLLILLPLGFKRKGEVWGLNL